jgi:hypothetical protein
MAREADLIDDTDSSDWYVYQLKRFEALVRADERMSFYGQDKPTECAEGCPPNQICDYCQVVAPVKAMILAEREACAKVCEEFARKWWKIHCDSNLHYSSTLKAHQDFCALQVAIKARGTSNANQPNI